MSSLLELSKQLKVRAEVLQQRISASGEEPPSLDADLSEEMESLLREEFPPPKTWRVKKLFKRLFGRKRAPLHADAADEHPDFEAPSDQPDSPAAPPREAAAEGLGEGEAIHGPLAVEQAPPPLSAMAGDRTGPAVEPVTGEDSEALLASLEHLEKVRDTLPEISVESSRLDLPGLEEEALDLAEGFGEREVGETEEEPALFLDEPLLAEIARGKEPSVEGVERELGSGELQEMLDTLIQDVEVREEPERKARREHPVTEVLNRGRVFFSRLSLQEKVFLGSALLVACLILGGGVYVNHYNYGKGGDRRFYEEGLAKQGEGELDAAQEAFRKVVRRYSNSPLVPRTYFHMAEIEKSRENFMDAERVMREGLRSQEVALGSASNEWSSEALEERRNGFYFVGEVSAARGDWDSAADWFGRVVEESADSSLSERARFQLADALFHRAQPKDAETDLVRQAIEAYEAAVDASPESEQVLVARLRLGETWERLAEKETGFSEAHLEKALGFYEELDPQKEKLSRVGIEPLEVDLRIARLMLKFGRVEESIGRYRRLLESPRDEFEEGPLPYRVPLGLARSLIERSKAYIGQNEPLLAQQDLSEALEIIQPRRDHPPDEKETTEMEYVKGHAYYHLGQLYLSATKDLENPYYIKMDAAYRNALDRDANFGPDGEDSLLAAMRRTNYHFQINKDYRVSAEAYKQILDEFPRSRYAYLARFRLAEAHFNLKELKEAEKQYSLVVEEFPQTRYVDEEAFRTSYFQLGCCRFLLEDFAGAAKTYKDLLGLIDYEDSEEALLAWKRLAWAYYQQGLYDKAVDEYRAFLAKYPGRDPDGKVRLSLGRALLQRFDYEEAREQFRTVVDEYPESEMARWASYQVCQSYLSESKLASEGEKRILYEKALAEAERIREVYKDEDRVLAILGEIHFELGNYRQAVVELEFYKISARKRKTPADFQFRLAESYYRLEDYHNAALNFQQLDVQELPREEAARALYLLGESLRLDKQLVKAAETYERLIEDYPTSALRDLAEGRVQEVRWSISKGI